MVSRSIIIGVALCLVSGCADRRVAGSPPAHSGQSGDAASPTAPDIRKQSAGPPKVPALTAASVAPLWPADTRAGKGHAAFGLEKWQLAGAHFAAALTQQDVEHRENARLLLGLSYAFSGQYGKAVQPLKQSVDDMPLLADFIRYHYARSLHELGQSGEAVPVAKKVALDSIVGPRAVLLVGKALRALGRHTAAVDHYKAYLKSSAPKRTYEIRYRLALAELAAGARKSAASRLRSLVLERPVGAWGKRAKAELDKINERVGSLSPSEQLTQGMALYHAQRNPHAAASLRLARQRGLSKQDECTAAYHQADSWFKERRREKSAPLFDQAIKICGRAKDTHLEIKAAYQAGRSYLLLRKYPLSASYFAKAEALARAANHSYADDARLRVAEAWEFAGVDAKIEPLLSQIPVLYPDGDMRAEAMWRLAWRAWKAKRYRAARKWLDKQLATKQREDNYWAEGQAAYWLGRVHTKLGDAAKARAAFQQAVLDYPLGYYALMALNRLRENDSQGYRDTVAKLGTLASASQADTALRFRPRPEYANIGFRRGIAFMRLGLGSSARQEFRKLGFVAPAGKKPVTDADDIEKLWAMAYLYDRAGEYQHSHWVTRWHVVEYKTQWPTTPDALARWRIAYPQAYWSLLKQHADKHGYPLPLQIGIVREESAFNPLLESWANAVGLTQMIYVTAKRFARGTGIAPTRANLRDPDNNVEIGSNFLAYLWKRWQGNLGLVVASYNAGAGAVTRYMRSRGTWALDEFVEAIPPDQTRRYTKRVLSSFFTYSYLYNGGAIPTLANKIPAKLRPKGRRGKRRRRRGRVDYGNYAD